jgi:hypothetical protein
MNQAADYATTRQDSSEGAGSLAAALTASKDASPGSFERGAGGKVDR